MVRSRALQVAPTDVLNVLDELIQRHRTCRLRGTPRAVFDGVPTIGGAAYAHCLKRKRGVLPQTTPEDTHREGAWAQACSQPRWAGACTFCGEECCNATVGAELDHAPAKLDFAGSGLTGGDYFCGSCFVPPRSSVAT